MGISFYTFQALSYTIDVYRRELETIHDPIRYLRFHSLLPHLVAGPIVRAKDLLGQFTRRRMFNAETAPDALRQILWGLFIKVVVADNLAVVVSHSYEHVADVSGWQLLYATVCFAIQIYGDFAGYTHIAIGIAHLLGIELMRNFSYPYFSQEHPRILGTLAHFPDHLVSPLSVRSLAEPRRLSALAAERDDRVRRQRFLAWRQLDVRRMGRHPRRALSLYGRRGPNRAGWRRKRRAASALMPSVATAAADVADVRADQHRLGILSAASVTDSLIILKKIAVDVATTGAEPDVQAGGDLDPGAGCGGVGAAPSRQPAARRPVSAAGAMEPVLRVRGGHFPVRADALYAVHLFPVLNVTHAP